MVPLTGLEPVRYRYRGILSPLRLPISPHQHNINILIDFLYNVKSFLQDLLQKSPIANFILNFFIYFNNFEFRNKFFR